MSKPELPDLIQFFDENTGHTKPQKELVREIVMNYNQLILFLEELYGRTEEQTSED